MTRLRLDGPTHRGSPATMPLGWRRDRRSTRACSGLALTMLRSGRSVSMMMTVARPTTTAPTPAVTSAKPLVCAKSEPPIATRRSTGPCRHRPGTRCARSRALRRADYTGILMFLPSALSRPSRLASIANELRASWRQTAASWRVIVSVNTPRKTIMGRVRSLRARLSAQAAADKCCGRKESLPAPPISSTYQFATVIVFVSMLTGMCIRSFPYSIVIRFADYLLEPEL